MHMHCSLPCTALLQITAAELCPPLLGDALCTSPWVRRGSMLSQFRDSVASVISSPSSAVSGVTCLCADVCSVPSAELPRAKIPHEKFDVQLTEFTRTGLCCN